MKVPELSLIQSQVENLLINLTAWQARQHMCERIFFESPIRPQKVTSHFWLPDSFLISTDVIFSADGGQSDAQYEKSQQIGCQVIFPKQPFLSLVSLIA